MTLGAPKDQEGLESKSTKVLIQTLHFTEDSLHSSSHLLWSFRGTAGHFGNSKTYIMANTHGNIFSINVNHFFSKNIMSTSGLNDHQVIGVAVTLSFHWQTPLWTFRESLSMSQQFYMLCEVHPRFISQFQLRTTQGSSIIVIVFF